MNRTILGAALSLALSCPVLTASTVQPAAANPIAPAPRIVVGQSAAIGGGVASAWAKILPNGRVTDVGLTVPLASVENPPAAPGDGPDGAYVLSFPADVQATTYFNHIEVDWNPNGHQPEQYFGVPHFDFHFESQPVEALWAIGFGVPLGGGLFGDPVAPSPDRLPAGYFYPGQDALVPFMGVHTFRPEDLKPADQFTAIQLAGFYNNQMIFLEPMITQRFLAARQSFTLNVPVPETLGRSTNYPTRFRGIYDRTTDSYNLVWSDFVAVTH